MNLALFDFDWTITNADMFTKFIHASLPRHRIVWGYLRLAPLIIGYKIKRVSAAQVRKRLVRFAFQGVYYDSLMKLGEQFNTDTISYFIRKEALDRIIWHQRRGDRVVIVSASLNVYLEPWCKEMGIELISSRLDTKAGKVTGELIGGDCSGMEKARRVKEKYRLESFETIFAYGDSDEDRAMLDLADKKFFKWNEVRGREF